MPSLNPVVYVVVLGDIGHSPRMTNHARSLKREGFCVHLIGYHDSRVPKDLNDLDSNVLDRPPKALIAYLPLYLSLCLKVFWMLMTFVRTIVYKWQVPDYILIQNPPALPILPICILFSKLFGVKLIVDWHNYGFSISRASVGDGFCLRFLTFFEVYFGSMAHASFCVTRKMRLDLLSRWNKNVISSRCPIVLYDRARADFGPTSQVDQHSLFCRLANQKGFESLVDALGRQFCCSANDKIDAVLRDRSALLVSGTSWTADEDFSILIEALSYYDLVVESKDVANLPSRLMVIVTGKGPLKEMYLNIVSEKEWKHVSFLAPWLDDPDDYKTLLGSADLGVSVHSSSSGLDLPMKAVDMFGCRLPVAALNFPCLNELVHDGENGYVFSNSEELGEILIKHFQDYPGPKYIDRKKHFESSIDEFRRKTWHEQWRELALPVFYD